MRELLQTTAQLAIRYLEGLDTRNVAPTQEAIANLIQFDQPLPNQPVEPELILQQLDEVGSPASMAMAGSRFFGFVIGGSLPVTLAANWLATVWDQNCGLYRITPATALLEQVALRWLFDVLHLPADCGGAFVTGATVASFTALAAARHSVLEREGWNVEADGLFGAPPITVAVSEEAHPSLLKALGLLGLGRSRVVKVPVDGQGRMRPDAIPTLTRPAIICTQVGNVNTGACVRFGKGRRRCELVFRLGQRRMLMWKKVWQLCCEWLRNIVLVNFRMSDTRYAIAFGFLAGSVNGSIERYLERLGFFKPS